MTRKEKKMLAVPALLTGAIVPLVLCAVMWTAHADLVGQVAGKVTATANNQSDTVHTSHTNLPGTVAARPSSPVSITNAIAKANPAPVNVAELDQRRQFALGMIETANKDRAIGRAGEVSRYQIMPSVWKHYSGSNQYQNPGVSLAVAQKHWYALYSSFKKKTRREPSDFDMYVLWNTRYGYYASRGFNPGRLHPVVRNSAQRFVNLVGRGES